MKKVFSLGLVTILMTLGLAPAAHADGTAEVSYSKTKIEASKDSVIDLVVSVEDFLMRSGSLTCGSLLSVDFPLTDGGGAFYRLNGAPAVRVGALSTNHRIKLLEPKDHPYLPWSTSVYVKMWYAFEIPIPRGTFSEPASCETLVTINNADGSSETVATNTKLEIDLSGGGQEFTGGDVTSSLNLTAEASPYYLKTQIRLADNAIVTVEAGAELIVQHEDAVFAGRGEVRIFGTTNDKVIVRNAATLWSAQGNLLTARHTVFLNFGSIFPMVGQRAWGLVLQDCYFQGIGPEGLQSSSLGATGKLILTNNYFEGIPGFTLPGWVKGYTLQIDGNWFEGNSTSNERTWGISGQWIMAEALSSFKDNTFSNFTSPVVFKRFLKRTSAQGPVNVLDIGPNYFDGYTNAESEKFVLSDPVRGPDYGGSGYRVSETLGSPPNMKPVLNLSEASQASGPKIASEELVSQRTLATFSESATGLTSLQRSQVKAAVEANPNAEKFICTGIRYYSQPMSVNIMVRKRAKAACDYAKELNPSLATWYQNKPTQARSYAGKVLLTVKTPAR